MKAGGGGGRKFIFQQGSRALLEKRRRKKRRVETFGAIGISRDPVLRMLVAVSSRWRSKIFDSGIRFVSIHWTGRPIPMMFPIRLFENTLQLSYPDFVSYKKKFATFLQMFHYSSIPLTY